MFARTALCARTALKPQSLRRGMAKVAHFEPPTMAELPTPSGSWKELYDKRQRKYNLHLLAGVLVVAGTVGYTGCVVFGFGPKIGK